MQYITTQELNTYIDTNTLNAITGGDNNLLNTVEQHAVDEMFGYLDVRYDARKIFSNASNTPKIIKMYLIDILLYHLHSRISPDHIPDLRKMRYDAAINWLEKIADGFINPDLPIKDKINKTPLRYGSGDKQTHYF